MIRVSQPSHGIAWQLRAHMKEPCPFSWGDKQHSRGGAWGSKTKWPAQMRPALVIFRQFRYSGAIARGGCGDVDVSTVARRHGYEGGSAIWSTPTVGDRRTASLTTQAGEVRVRFGASGVCHSD